MQKTIFNTEDIHRLRVETAERYATMTPEAAQQDRRRNAEETRRAIENMRRANTRTIAAQTKRKN